MLWMGKKITFSQIKAHFQINIGPQIDAGTWTQVYLKFDLVDRCLFELGVYSRPGV